MVYCIPLMWVTPELCIGKIEKPLEQALIISLICQLKRSTTLHYTTLHYTTPHYTTLHCTTLTTLHYTTLHYTALHHTTLHYTALHYTTLHYTTLHYTTLQLHYTHTTLCLPLLILNKHLLFFRGESGQEADLLPTGGYWVS